jgi:hypothetical protein
MVVANNAVVVAMRGTRETRRACTTTAVSGVAMAAADLVGSKDVRGESRSHPVAERGDGQHRQRCHRPRYRSQRPWS